MHLAPGTLVTPDVRLVAPLSAGAMGTLWVAEHLRLGTRVAVKFVAHKLVGDAAALARFRREAEAAAQLRSIHVVRTIDYGTMDGGAPYIVMELLEGETLGARLRRSRSLSLAEAARVVSHVAQALGEAHALGIVHRDIKADNIFLVDAPNGLLAKVLDFGMAKHHSARAGSLVTATGVIVGTPEYMSPEQVLGSKHVDHRADLWALGVVTYRMLFGIMPFAAETPHALVFNICKGIHGKPSELGLPDVLDVWFARALAPQIGRRFASARDLADAFEAAARVTEQLGFGDQDFGELPTLRARARAIRRHATEARADEAPDSTPELDVSGPISLNSFDDAALAATVAVHGLGEQLLDGDTLERVAAPATPGSSPSVPPSSALGSSPGVPPSSAFGSSPSPSRGFAQLAPSRSASRSLVVVLGGAVLVAAIGILFVLGRFWRPGSVEAPTSGPNDVHAGEPPSADPSTAAQGGNTVSAGSAEVRAASSDAGRAAATTAARGTLSLVCEPRCEQVLVDDWMRGPSPLSGLELEPGTHRVTLRRNDRPPRVIQVEIVSGRETRRMVSMPAALDAGAPSAPPAASGSPGSATSAVPAIDSSQSDDM